MSALGSKLSKASSTQLAPGDLLVVLLGWVLWGNWLGPYSPSSAPEFSLSPSIPKELRRTNECVLLGSVLPPFDDHRLVIFVFLSVKLSKLSALSCLAEEVSFY